MEQLKCQGRAATFERSLQGRFEGVGLVKLGLRLLQVAQQLFTTKNLHLTMKCYNCVQLE